MKLLVFADVHGDLSALEHIKKEIKEKQVDVAICAGDYTFFEDHIEFMTKKLAELGTEIILIHGNHEFDEIAEVLCKEYKNVHFLHKKSRKIGNYVFLGYGGGGFVYHDPEFIKTMKTLTKNIDKNAKIVLVTHAPPYGSKTDMIPGYGHVGNKDYRAFIEEHNVVLAVHGHIHEAFGKEDKIGRAKVVNPGPKGKIFVLE